ncbi:glycosyltransferase family 4 protein [Spirosoma pomorum]
MKVLFDHQCFTGGMYGGVSRYFYDLMRSFTHIPDVDFDLSLLLSNNDYLNRASFSKHLRYRRFAHTKRVNQAASALNRINSLRQIKAGNFDVFHPTYYHRYFLDTIGKKPFVLTFYDAASERYKDQYPDLGEGLTQVKQQLLDRADAVISISDFTSEELLRYFKVDPAKIKVVHLGTEFSEPAIRSVRQPKPVDFPYLLFVGKRELYKNFNGFYRAIQPVMKRHPDLHLICAGGGTFTPTELATFQAAGLSNRTHYHPITDASLMGLYQHALAFVFPSLNEGFGIPVLEAFSGNCPVVLSDRTSLPEVGQDAALYFDPDDDESVADAIERVVTDASLRESLRQKGDLRLRDFSCDKTARQTLEVYKSLC